LAVDWKLKTDQEHGKRERMMRILQMLGVMVVSVMFLAEPSVANHHKKGGSKAKVGQKRAPKSSPGPGATQKAAKQKPGAKFGGQERDKLGQQHTNN
jgi:hypothetical protein